MRFYCRECDKHKTREETTVLTNRHKVPPSIRVCNKCHTRVTVDIFGDVADRNSVLPERSV